MKRSVIIFLHVGYWLIWLFLAVSTLYVVGSNFKGNPYASIALNTFLSGTCFYTFYFVLVPKFLAQRKIRRFVTMGLITAFITAAIMITIHALTPVKDVGDTDIVEASDTLPIILNWTMNVIFHTIIGLVHGLLATFMRGFFSWYDDIHIKELLEKKNLETQLLLIKSRIDPHFLFNTLNNIDVLIKSDPSLASIYLQKLCSIMRFTLYENHTEFIPLQREIEIVKEYIELQKIRSSKNFISVELSGDVQGISIAPMVLLPFVENAIKHSDGQKTENAVVVKIEVAKDSRINFFCRNLIARNPTAAVGGIGIDLIKSRLDLLYPNKHELVLGEKDHYFEANLTILTT